MDIEAAFAVWDRRRKSYMSNRLDMKKDTNNRKDKTKYDGPEKPDAYMGNDKQWVFGGIGSCFC